MTDDHYSTLGVTRDVEPEVISAAYRALSKRLHPDRPDGDAERYARVNAAHDELRDPSRRAEYDLTLSDAATTPDTEPADADDDLADEWGEVVDSFDDYAEVVEPTPDKPTRPRRGARGGLISVCVAGLVVLTTVFTALVSGWAWAWLVLAGLAGLSIHRTRATGASLVTAILVVALAWCVRDTSSSLTIAASWATWSLPLAAFVAVLVARPREE